MLENAPLSEHRKQRLFYFQTHLIAFGISSKKSQCFLPMNQKEVIDARNFLTYQDEKFASYLVSVWEWYTEEAFTKYGKKELIWWLENYIDKNILGGK
jgi:hypothetical protein